MLSWVVCLFPGDDDGEGESLLVVDEEGSLMFLSACEGLPFLRPSLNCLGTLRAVRL